MDAKLIVDIEDENGIILATAGTQFDYSEFDQCQLIDGELIFVDEDEFEIV